MYNQFRNDRQSSSQRGGSGRGGSQSYRGQQGGRSQYGGRSQGRPGKKSSIDISKFINAVVETAAASTPVEPVVDKHAVTRTFHDFELHQNLKSNILEKGYTSPTPIQDQAIEPILRGRDLLGIANTGTGKTGAFLIPIIHDILHDRSKKTLIMVPTRELALQIKRELEMFAGGLNISSALCIGGSSMYRQRSDLQRRFNFVIGTPGRLKDLIQQNILDLSDFQTLVLDEVDQMLDMGFIHDMRMIIGYMPQQRQSLFFSATLSPTVKQLIGDFSRDLVMVSVKTVETAVTIEQDVVRVRNSADKLDILHDLLISPGFDKVLIFGRTKRGVHKLSRTLNERGFKTESIHGNKSQPQRQRALKQFHYNEVRILVATDVAARGLDIQDVTHVINYDLPETYDDYVHRIGRTGRANKKGVALTFVEG